MNRSKEILKYIIADYFCSAITWTAFWIFRKQFIESEKFGVHVPLDFNTNFFIALLVIPAFWIFLHFLSGLYVNVYRKSRIAEIKQLFFTDIIGVLILFFTLLLKNVIIDYKSYYFLTSVLFSMQFILTSFTHFLITTRTNRKIHKRKIGFNTVLVGSNSKAIQLFDDMESQEASSGNKFVGFVHVDSSNGMTFELSRKLKHLGEFENIHDIILKENVDEVIIAIESSEHKYIETIINKLSDTNTVIKIIPDMYDILTGSVKFSSINDAPLIVVSKDVLQPKQVILKRTFDILSSLFCLVILSPIYLIIAVIIKATSKGPVFYSQERIGLHSKPFTIYKFRSMTHGAEKNGPALSSKDDNRITKVGKFLRKTRLDELPQFFNVLMGSMSVVGPRPERRFFIDQIIQKAPQYTHLQKIKPGITSWGQVKYGYAENVEQMVRRMKYDILYLENISFLLDMRIIIYTVLIVFQGRGK
ncbi:MAG TPA: sugar transferase [Bacteroidia bacterium]|nr:sugar transferase [Bacteroidia bacterium]